MLLMALLLQRRPALLLVGIVRQHIFEAPYRVAAFHGRSQLAPQVSVTHCVSEVGHDLFDFPLQVFRNWQITTLGIAEHSLCLVQFLQLPGIETPSDSLAFLECIPDVCRNTHDAPGVRIKIIIVLVAPLCSHRPRQRLEVNIETPERHDRSSPSCPALLPYKNLILCRLLYSFLLPSARPDHPPFRGGLLKRFQSTPKDAQGRLLAQSGSHPRPYTSAPAGTPPATGATQPRPARDHACPRAGVRASWRIAPGPSRSAS